MRLLVGLGNPGNEYVKTRHNIGFVCVDKVIKELKAGEGRSFAEGLLWEVSFGKEKALIFKPLKYMNRSGLPIQEVISYFGIDSKDVCVVADDVYIHPGSVRIRHTGSDGGHNGWKSVQEHIKPDNFLRVRIGVGIYEQHPQKRMHQPALDDYVQQPLPSHDRKSVENVIDKIVPNLIQWLEQGTLSEETIHI